MNYYTEMNKTKFLLNDEKISRWAYYYCEQIENDPLVSRLITNSFYAYRYCKRIRNDPKIRKYIMEPWDLYHYVNDVDDEMKQKYQKVNLEVLRTRRRFRL